MDLKNVTHMSYKKETKKYVFFFHRWRDLVVNGRQANSVWRSTGKITR